MTSSPSWHIVLRCYRCRKEEDRVISRLSSFNASDDYMCSCGGHLTAVEVTLSKKPESLLQHRIQKRLRQEFPDCYVRKIHGNEFQHSGLPDLICCILGMFFGIEVKVDGGEPSQLQSYEGLQIMDAGGVWFVADSPEQAIKVVRDVLGGKARR